MLWRRTVYCMTTAARRHAVESTARRRMRALSACAVSPQRALPRTVGARNCVNVLTDRAAALRGLVATIAGDSLPLSRAAPTARLARCPPLG